MIAFPTQTVLSFSFNNNLRKWTIICMRLTLNVLDYYTVCLTKYFVKDLFSWLFLTVTVSEDEIGLCPFLLTGALIPECEPGVQPGASLRPG